MLITHFAFAKGRGAEAKKPKKKKTNDTGELEKCESNALVGRVLPFKSKF